MVGTIWRQERPSEGSSVLQEKDDENLCQGGSWDEGRESQKVELKDSHSFVPEIFTSMPGTGDIVLSREDMSRMFSPQTYDHMGVGNEGDVQHYFWDVFLKD